jgi:proteasome lid subunit RPN8/RPN11
VARLVDVLAMSTVEITSKIIHETVASLRASPTKERVVLWLGQRQEGLVRIHEVHLPIQETEADYFRIPPEGMSALFAYLRPRRWMIAAQVHTHPGRAFHSSADDRWAIVRHEGALSLVVPWFCQSTTDATFERDALVYQLDASDRFILVPGSTAYKVVA